MAIDSSPPCNMAKLCLLALPMSLGISILGHHASIAQMPMPAMAMPSTEMQGDRTLPVLPDNLPAWLSNKQKNHIYRKRGRYNDDVYRNVPHLGRDLNAVAVGHALAYEHLVTGKANDLETKTFQQIDWVLKHPPRLMPDEASISATFGRRFGVLEQVFDWTHILHAQTIDVLASNQLTDAEKDAAIERLYQFYKNNVPYAITGLPMNMGYLDSQPYSKAFRQKYPKVNGLFWGYHWLQGAMYDALYQKSNVEQRTTYDITGKQYREVELYRTDRAFMPMFAALSPRFATRFPEISNTFDNLHMLHDLVNDILASDWMTEQQQDEQVKRAIWLVMDANHKAMEAGKQYGKDGLHDHRYMPGMPGMGMMPEGTTGHDHTNHSEKGKMPGMQNTPSQNEIVPGRQDGGVPTIKEIPVMPEAQPPKSNPHHNH